MRPIPKKMRDEIEKSGRNKFCALRGRGYGLCSAYIQWHHIWIYAGSQINEPWAILGACEYHHRMVEKDPMIKETFEKISLTKASDKDLEKYPKKDWKSLQRKLLKKSFDHPGSMYQWLLHRGGRTIRDIKEDKNGKYVIMRAPGNTYEKQYIPKKLL